MLCEEGNQTHQPPLVVCEPTSGVTIRQVPHVALDLKRAGPVAPLRDVPADALGEVVVLEEADALGCLQSQFGGPAMTRAHATHQARADEEEKRGRGDEEPVERGGGTGAVDDVAFACERPGRESSCRAD
jgi:hypothetical protein